MLYPVDFAMNNSVADTDFYMKFLIYRTGSSLMCDVFSLYPSKPRSLEKAIVISAFLH